MMGAYSGIQIPLFKRFQTHRQFVNKAQFEVSFTSQLTAYAVANVKEDLHVRTFPMSALAAEQTRYGYNELIEITYIYWHHSFSRHTGPMVWNGLPVALRLTSVDHSALSLSLYIYIY